SDPASAAWWVPPPWSVRCACPWWGSRGRGLPVRLELFDRLLHLTLEVAAQLDEAVELGLAPRQAVLAFGLGQLALEGDVGEVEHRLLLEHRGVLAPHDVLGDRGRGGETDHQRGESELRHPRLLRRRS